MHEQSGDLDLEHRRFRSRILLREWAVCPGTHVQVHGVVSSRAEDMLRWHIWYDAFLFLLEFWWAVARVMLWRWCRIVDFDQNGDEDLLQQSNHVFLLAGKIQGDPDAGEIWDV